MVVRKIFFSVPFPASQTTGSTTQINIYSAEIILFTSASHSEGYFSAENAGGDGSRCVVGVTVGSVWRSVCSVANIPCRKTQFILSSVNIEQVSDQGE